MKILGIDPGSEQTAWTLWDTESREPWQCGIEFNSAGLYCAHAAGVWDVAVVERLQSFLTRVGRTTFDAQWWAGRIYESMGKRRAHIERTEVKRILLGRVAGNDADIRAYLIDRFGPTRREAVGLKANPGPCYYVKKDCWQALAVAVAWYDREHKP